MVDNTSIAFITISSPYGYEVVTHQKLHKYGLDGGRLNRPHNMIKRKQRRACKGVSDQVAIPHVITSIMVPFPIPAENRELLSQFRETE